MEPHGAEGSMTAAQLHDHLRDTLDYVLRWRALMAPSGNVIDGMPRGGGFGSQLPYAGYAADMADREIAAVGNLAKHVDIRAEINGRLCIPGFAFCHGRCVGMSSEGKLARIAKVMGSSDPYAPIRLQLNTMRANATLITRVEGVGEHLLECERVRQVSMRQFKRVDDEWLTKAQAAEAAGRSERTIADWGSAGTITVSKYPGGETLYLASSVKLMAEKAREAKRAAMAKANLARLNKVTS